MATILYKLDGERITPADANAAMTAFINNGGVPENYTFHHWSSSSTIDNEVTELNDGNSGIIANRDVTFYPVIGVRKFISITRNGTDLNYKTLSMCTTGINNDIDSPENAFAFYFRHYLNSTDALYLFVVQKDVQFSTNQVGNNVPIGTTGNVKYDESAANVDFGLIYMPVTNAANPKFKKAFRTVSDIDGKNYQIKVEGIYDSGNVGLQLTSVFVTVYREENGAFVVVPKEKIKIGSLMFEPDKSRSNT